MADESTEGKFEGTGIDVLKVLELMGRADRDTLRRPEVKAFVTRTLIDLGRPLLNAQRTLGVDPPDALAIAEDGTLGMAVMEPAWVEKFKVLPKLGREALRILFIAYADHLRRGFMVLGEINKIMDLVGEEEPPMGPSKDLDKPG
jgi:hypothetical protein